MFPVKTVSWSLLHLQKLWSYHPVPSDLWGQVYIEENHSSRRPDLIPVRIHYIFSAIFPPWHHTASRTDLCSLACGRTHLYASWMTSYCWHRNLLRFQWMKMICPGVPVWHHPNPLCISADPHHNHTPRHLYRILTHHYPFPDVFSMI